MNLARYPLSCLDGTAPAAFATVLGMHRGGGKVLDLTYGTGRSWGERPDDGITLVKADISGGKDVVAQDLFAAVIDRPDWIGAFDVVYYDPPWFVDIGSSTKDPREAAYGGYSGNARSFDEYVTFVATLPSFLKPGGKAIVKCSDQFHVPTRRLLLLHVEWVRAVEAVMDVVDFYVYRYHRVSPTAYQVKDRPCAVIAHSYFIVGQKR